MIPKSGYRFSEKIMRKKTISRFAALAKSRGERSAERRRVLLVRATPTGVATIEVVSRRRCDAPAGDGNPPPKRRKWFIDPGNASFSNEASARERTMGSHEIHEHHENAANHHEHAAKHHREAAKHHKAGNHEKAAHHSKVAHGHSLHATEHHEHASKKHAEHHG
jgi:hypothetical protein